MSPLNAWRGETWPNMYMETLIDGTSNPGTSRAPKGVSNNSRAALGISQHMIRLSNNVGWSGGRFPSGNFRGPNAPTAPGKQNHRVSKWTNTYSRTFETIDRYRVARTNSKKG